MQTLGGGSPQIEGMIVKFWPNNPMIRLTFQVACWHIDQGLGCTFNLSLWFSSDGRLDFGSIPWSSTLALHVNMKWKIILKGGEDLGLEPRS